MKKKLSKISLFCGIMGNAPAFWILSIVAIITGHIALYKIKKNPVIYTGKKLAIWGLIFGYIGLLTALLLGAWHASLMNQIMELDI